jgi:pseudouridine-5'-phosphate glycosidase
MKSSLLRIHPEVAEAISAGRPVVALESTIISHGMPYPQNVETARAVEDIVRSEGAVPATMALLDGKMMAGLSDDDLEKLASGPGVWKVSLRDMALVLSQKLPGATTVAATLHIAALAGIRIFVTGGIGGVHRGAAETFDISADLPALGRYDVAVVSAGVKSVLDIGLTLEYLETLGVPVVTIGQDAFPSFYSRDSGFPSPLRLDSPDAIARMLSVRWDSGLQGGVLLACPVPESEAVPRQQMETFIESALALAHRKGISGKDITPFLLKNIAQETGGKSLAANISLVKNNAALGARVSVALAGQSF